MKRSTLLIIAYLSILAMMIISLFAYARYNQQTEDEDKSKTIRIDNTEINVIVASGKSLYGSINKTDNINELTYKADTIDPADFYKIKKDTLFLSNESGKELILEIKLNKEISSVISSDQSYITMQEDVTSKAISLNANNSTIEITGPAGKQKTQDNIRKYSLSISAKNKSEIKLFYNSPKSIQLNTENSVIFLHGKIDSLSGSVIQSSILGKKSPKTINITTDEESFYNFSGNK